MYLRKAIWALTLLLGLGLAQIPLVQAAPPAQLTTFPTPTPGPDGRIVYTIQKGDTLWRISAITGVSIDQLRSLNNLGADEALREGEPLIIGFAGPVELTPTPGSTATPRPDVPTPTPQQGWGIICVLLYNDLNGDSLRQETEPSIPGGAINLSNRSGSVSITSETISGEEPQCFEELSEGDYNITVAIPDGFNPTTVLNRALELKAGNESYLGFGAQANSETEAETTLIPESPGRSPIMGIFGGILLAAGAGLGIYAGLLRRSLGGRKTNGE